MPWQKIIFHVTSQHAELLSDRLTDAGALSVSLEDAADQPILEPLPNTTPLWQDVQVCALFPIDALWQAPLETVLPDWQSLLQQPLQTITLADQDWVRASLADWHAFMLGSICICPSWTKPLSEAKHVIKLDPGLAFGTGTHPTTALCVQWLDQHIQTNMQVIDYGCGSGILAMVAAKLGANSLYAIDYDPQALQATTDNVKNNDLNHLDWHILEPKQMPAVTADIIIANILATPLITLATTFAKLIKKNGLIALSGLLTTQVEDIINAYRAAGFSELSAIEQAGWALVTGRRE